MLRILVALAALLLAVWVVVGLLGWLVEGLFWLAVVGVVVLAGSALLGSSRRRH